MSHDSKSRIQSVILVTMLFIMVNYKKRLDFHHFPSFFERDQEPREKKEKEERREIKIKKIKEK